MATNLADLTPNDGTGQGSNPGDGTENSAGGGNGAPNEAPPQDWETKYKNSSREAQRLYQQNQAQAQAWLAEQARYNAEIALLRQQQASPQRGEHGQGNEHGHGNDSGADYLSEEEGKALSNAVIDQNTAEVRRLSSLSARRAARAEAEASEKRFFDKLQNASSAVSRNQALTNLIQSVPGATDPNSPGYQRLNQRYSEILNDPEFVNLRGNAVNFGTPQQPNWVDPAVLTVAVREVKQEFRQAAPPVRQDGFTEPANRAAAPARGTVNYMALMTAEERGMCDRSKMKYSDWFNYCDTKEERIKKGRPLTRVRGIIVE